MDNRTIKNNGYFAFRLGSLQLLIVSDGQFDLGTVQPLFAPQANAEEVADFLTANFQVSDNLTLAGNVLVAITDTKVILFDTGSGKRPDANTGLLLNNLASAGIRPEDVTDIVLTHAHPDHLGGLLNEDGSSIFTKAHIHISQVEYDYWMAEQPDFSKGTYNAIADYEIMFAQKYLAAIQSQLHFFEDGAVVFDCIKLQLAPGHTPGHAIATLFSDGQELAHFADTFQHILLLAHPEWGNQIDSDFELAVATRRKLGEQWATKKTFLFGDHLPYPGLGFVRKNGAGFEWIPKAFYAPH